MTTDTAPADLPVTAPADPMADSIRIDKAMRLAHQHWTAGQVDQAERVCQGILREWPGYADALHLLGVMAHTWNNHEAAIEYLRAACRAPRAPALYHSNLAEMLRQKGLLEEAEEHAQRSVELEPNLAQGWNNLGIIAQERGLLGESAIALERAIGLNNRFVEAYGNLGNTQKARGELLSARHSYEKALELRPQQPVLSNNLAAVLLELGEFDAALKHARSAVEVQPRLTDAYLNAALIESRRGRGDEAVRWLNGLLSFDPDNIDALIAKARTLIALEQLSQALACADRAVQLKPDQAAALAMRAEILALQGDVEEALTVYDSAIEKAEKPAPLMAEKALRLMEVGQFKEGNKLFDKALRLDPEQPLAWHQRVQFKTFEPGDRQIAVLHKVLAKPVAQKIDAKIALTFAIAKAHFDAGDTAVAWEHLHAGNRLKRATLSYDAGEISRWMTSVINHHQPDLFVEAAGKGGDLSELPIFIVGLPQSGLTLVEQILAAHSGVVTAGELSTIQTLSRRIYNTQRQLQAYPSYIKALGPAQRTSLGQQYISCLKAEIPKGRGGRVERIVDKAPLNFFYAGLIHLIAPNARIIHVRRDPRDVGLSCYAHLFSNDFSFAYDLEEIADFIVASDSLLTHWGATLPEDRWLDVDYEAVVANPDAEARRILDFTGLKWEAAIANYWKRDRVIRTGNLLGHRQPPDASHIGHWQDHTEALEPLLSRLSPAPVQDNALL